MVDTEVISIDFPLKGEWRFLRPPGHHRFAYDFVQTNTDRKSYSRRGTFSYLLGSIAAGDYYCWDQPVFAPINGTVIGVGEGQADNEKTNLWTTIAIWYNATYRFRPKKEDGPPDIRPNAGNYVMIESEDRSHIVFLAHLRNGSVEVEENQRVSSGDLLGRVGNSGNSTAPHLHINLFDQMEDPFEATVLPFVFTNFEELEAGAWRPRTLDVPEILSFIRVE